MLTLQADIEGAGVDGCLQLGAPASLVVEGHVGEGYSLEDIALLIKVVMEGGGETMAEFRLPLSDVILGLGAFLSQIDFRAERVGIMAFFIALEQKNQILVETETKVRVINTLRDASGRARSTGAGALKVQK